MDMCLGHGDCATREDGVKKEGETKRKVTRFSNTSNTFQVRSYIEKDIPHILNVAVGTHSSPPLAFSVRGRQLS